MIGVGLIFSGLRWGRNGERVGVRKTKLEGWAATRRRKDVQVQDEEEQKGKKRQT